MKQGKKKDTSPKTRRALWMALLIPGIAETPLSKMDEIYREYVQDANTSESVVDLINKDIRRTRISPVHGLHRNYLDEKIDGERAGDVVARILKVFAHTNQSIGYVQGMNIICSIIYYVVSHDDWVYSEAVAYFCFFHLMVEFGDYFTEKMDDAETGLRGEQKSVMQILWKVDKKLYTKIKKKDLFGKGAFHIRWMVLLFSAEFTLEDTFLLWERFFKEAPKRKLIPYFCAGMLIVLRDRIIEEEEMETITSLEVARLNPHEVLSLAEKLLKKVPYTTLKTDPIDYLQMSQKLKNSKLEAHAIE
ncbi:TBC1 domain family member 13 [Nematocida minor]|uniref:TBC1 domain family member 13 n=1 Tax=Nematocida minor TaxID=1912983 RepID=UPI00221F42D6|nr:TBC1 domain family member 13 [Nematocida minor]KAI5191530.1 TBC1 domain family member 13 [Nematocida minor]